MGRKEGHIVYLETTMQTIDYQGLLGIRWIEITMKLNLQINFSLVCAYNTTTASVVIFCDY